MSDVPTPPERERTVRDALHDALREGPETVRELSIRVGATQKDVVHHLEHLERSLSRTGEALVMEPSRCLGCDFRFDTRVRFEKPGRCPACRSTRITWPRFRLADSGA